MYNQTSIQRVNAEMKLSVTRKYQLVKRTLILPGLDAHKKV